MRYPSYAWLVSPTFDWWRVSPQGAFHWSAYARDEYGMVARQGSGFAETADAARAAAESFLATA